MRCDCTSSCSGAGGTALFTGLRDRLERELSEAAPHTAKVKVTSPANALERRFSVWIGARPSSNALRITSSGGFALLGGLQPHQGQGTKGVALATPLGISRCQQVDRPNSCTILSLVPVACGALWHASLLGHSI